ncbi:MAG: hypothetical protein ACJAUH_001632 [Saprospiraceae bacterium]|jgi:hypothetical protein
MIISTNVLFAQTGFEIKYDETQFFEDSVSLETYLIPFKKRRMVYAYEKINSKTLIEKDIYHIIYEDSLAKKKNFRMGYGFKIDTSYFFSETFFYFQKEDTIFVRYLERGEQKCHIQYNLKSTTKAKSSPTWLVHNISYFHSEDYIDISNIRYECYVFEEINDNYRELVYIDKENGFLLKKMTFYNNSTDVVEAYEINKINTQK